MWRVTTILVVLTASAWTAEGVQKREGQPLTWAQVAESGETAEYDDSFFRNDDYEYVDASEVELPPPPETDTSHKLERRTVGYIIGELMGGDETEDIRPARSSAHTATPPPSSFLESIMRAVDNFIVADLKGWSKFLTAMSARTSTPPPVTTTTPRPVAIQPPKTDEEVVVIMDEFGRPQVVTINDIVASLSQLDEQSITELLLGPINPPSAPKPALAPAKSSVADLFNAIADTQNRLPAHSQARTNESPTTASPIRSQTIGPTLSPTNRPSVRPTDSPNIISSTRSPTIAPLITSSRPIITSTPRPIINSTPRPIINSTPRPIINSTPRPIITSTPRPIITTPKPIISSTHPQTNRHSAPSSPHAPKKRPTSFPNISSIPSPTRAPNKTPIDVPNFGAIIRPTISSQRAPTRGPTQVSIHGPTRSQAHISIHSPTRGPTHTFVRGTPTSGPTRRPIHTVTRGTPTRTLAQSFAQGIPTGSPTRAPTRGPTRSPGQVLVRESPRTSSPSIVRGTPIHIPTGIPTRSPGRPNTVSPDFLLPSASRDNAVKRSSSDSVARPVRHTGPSHGAPPREGAAEDEMILVRDETGAVHVVTIQDIMSSLAALSPETAQDLLFGEAPVAPPNTANFLQGTQEAPRPRRPASVQDVIAAAEAAEEPHLPRPAQGASPAGKEEPLVPGPAPNTPRLSLEDALRQQDIPEDLVQLIAAPSILRPVTKAPPVQQPAPEGFGASLRGMLSRFVGGQQQQQQVPPQHGQAAVGRLGLVLPQPIHHQETATSLPNTVSVVTKRSSDATLPPALQHLSPAVQAALLQQADDVPSFVPPDPQHAAARSDAGPVQYVDTEAPRDTPSPTPPPKPAPTSAPPLVLPPAVLKQLPPSVLNKVTKQYIEARVGGAAQPQAAQERDYYQPVAHYYDYEVLPPVVHLPVHGYHPPAHHGYDDGYADYGDLAPMLDIFLLADVTKVHKVGDTNLSFKAPKVGDPAYFVDTRPKDHHY